MDGRYFKYLNSAWTYEYTVLDCRQIFVYKHSHVHTYIYIYISYIQKCNSTNSLCIYIYICMSVYMRTRTNPQTHTHTHMHAHVYNSRFFQLCSGSLVFVREHAAHKNTIEMQKTVPFWAGKTERGGGLGSRPKKMYGERLGDGVEYHLMSPTPRR